MSIFFHFFTFFPLLTPNRCMCVFILFSKSPTFFFIPKALPSFWFSQISLVRALILSSAVSNLLFKQSAEFWSSKFVLLICENSFEFFFKCSWLFLESAIFYVLIFNSPLSTKTFKVYFKIICIWLFEHLKTLGCFALSLVSVLFTCVFDHFILYSSSWLILIYGDFEESRLRELLL